MRFLLFSLILSIVSALNLPNQVPFHLDFQSPIKELHSLKDQLSIETILDLESKWRQLELKHGKDQLLNKYNNFKHIHFSKDVKPSSYSINSEESHPEVLGFDTVKQISGYFEVEQLNKQYFFWFFESRNDPKNDPLIIWLNGGPGCSSMCGLSMELGPGLINSSLEIENNPFSWNNNASILFLDQPADVGFSKGGKIPFTTEEASVAFVNFVKTFLETYPEYSNLDLHIAGESYAGHYIPKFAHSVKQAHIDLKSVLIGNGITDPLNQWEKYADMGCGEGGIGQIYTNEECYDYPKQYESYKPIGELCYKYRNPIICFITSSYMPNFPQNTQNLNPYDSRIECKNGTSLCYEEIDWLNSYFNLPYVQESLNVEKEFIMCNSNVGLNFITDLSLPYHEYVKELLDDDVPVLIYAGDKDLVCDWLGNFNWVSKLNYTNHVEFEKSEFKDWTTLDGKHAGQVKNHEGFTFLRVFDSGHMVPKDSNKNALDMVNRWVKGDYAFSKSKSKN
ncbi:unnamed protein product [Candida verbasci]|uniref:Carboxypeptidase n=1 Tax=Candida verbasci TaxID=1227364 RepID=A0A9W4TYB0_9ASCO|nr:unnamed protein product [Candida verbasci]